MGAAAASEMRAPTFSVVSMMREDRAVVQQFASYYRAAGAERIFIFHDGPLSGRDEIDLAGVDLVECDGRFWTELSGLRPASLEDAQSAVFMAGMAKCTSDWLLVVDADEFIIGNRSIRSLLSSIPPNVDAVRVPTAEAVWGPADDFGKPFACTHLRSPLPERYSGLLARLLYGNLHPYFSRGLVGHTVGKHFVRKAGRYTRIECHNSEYQGRPIGRWAEQISSANAGFAVAHFDPIDFDRWKSKWSRRRSGEVVAAKQAPHRARHMNRAHKALLSGERSARRLFRRLYRINRLQKFLLTRIGCLRQENVFGRNPPRD